MDETKLENELLPCPFCGFLEIRLVNADCVVWNNLHTNYYCICDQCDTWQAVSDTKEEAINKWNRRFNG